MRSRDALSPLQKIAADRLADEVAVLVTRGYLDARSAAADALLDYREPPRSPRSDRLAELENGVAAERARIRRELLAESAEIMYGPSDSALRDALDRICPEERAGGRSGKKGV